jgi:hypothetical protein
MSPDDQDAAAAKVSALPLFLMRVVLAIIGGLEQQSNGRQANVDGRGCADFYRASGWALDLSAAIEAGKESITQ